MPAAVSGFVVHDLGVGVDAETLSKNWRRLEGKY